MTLKKYLEKRNFKITIEPKVQKKNLNQKAKDGDIYVIQKHAARHLHYDLRLQLGNALKSFAVPKGPSLNSDIKRLAVEVEDHPLEYANFEGTIPENQYGAGSVIVWDNGSWQCEGDSKKAYQKGNITFQLKGKKLKGKWKLIRMQSKNKNDKKNWLFFKLKDKYEKKDYDIVKNKPYSVMNTPKKSTQKNTPLSLNVLNELKKITHIKKSKIPKAIKPQLCTLTISPPLENNWIHEVKFDGYRIITVKDKTINLFSRNGLNWTNKLSAIQDALSALSLPSIILDGEIVALDKKGISNFQMLQNYFDDKKSKSTHLQYYVFDILYYNGYNLMKVPLLERKRLLKLIFDHCETRLKSNIIIYSDYIQGKGEVIFKKACQKKLEGIISKEITSPYEQKRTTSWLKTKCKKQQEFVIGGFTLPKGNRNALGALLLGYYDHNQKLIYSGKVGTGFNETTLENLKKNLAKITCQASPFLTFPKMKLSDIIWVKPKLIAVINFLSWTKDGRLRHPSFEGLRNDKNPKSVVKEVENAAKVKTKK